MNRLLRSLVTTAVAVLAFAATAANAQPPVYSMTPIGPIPDSTGPTWRADDLNDKGEVAGSIDIPNPGQTRGFLWRNGEFTEFMAPSGNPDRFVTALAINNRSEIFGTADAMRPFRWKNGVSEDMGFFPGQIGIFPWHANDWGQTAGTAGFDGPDLPYVSTGDTAIMLDALPGGEGTQTVGEINNFGIAVGSSGTADGQRAVVWFTGSATPWPLNVLAGVTNSGANSLNDVGQILVSQVLPQGRRLTVWNFGTYTVLRGLNGEDVATSGRDINNAGQIIGTSFDPATGTDAFVLWHRGTAYRLSDLISAADPHKPYVRIITLMQINNRGQILVTGVDSRGSGALSSFLLTPAAPLKRQRSPG